MTTRRWIVLLIGVALTLYSAYAFSLSHVHPHRNVGGGIALAVTGVILICTALWDDRL